MQQPETRDREVSAVRGGGDGLIYMYIVAMISNFHSDGDYCPRRKTIGGGGLVTVGGERNSLEAEDCCCVLNIFCYLSTDA